MSRIVLIFFFIVFNFAYISATLQVSIVSQTDNTITNIFPTPNTIYIINHDIHLSGDVTIPNGCILDFQGGAIYGGNIIGNSTEIRAGQYHIFKNGLNLSGTFSNESFSAYWFGASSNNPNNAPAINYALNNSQATPIILPNLIFKVTEPIILDQRWQHLICHGTLQTSSDIPIIVLRNEKPTIKIRRLEYNGKGYGATGILFSGNVYNGNIDVDFFKGLKYAIRFTPKITFPGSKVKYTYVGSQYNKISWQYIDCMTGIQFEIDNENTDINYWVTENQFFGGRIKALYGINSEVADYMKISLINGNVFNCIGFEGEADHPMKLPINLKHADFNEFNDLRMSEGIETGTFIKMRYCAYNNFNIKSRVPVAYIDAENCAKIQISALLTDTDLSGYSYGYNLLYIDNSDPLHLSGKAIYSISRQDIDQSKYLLLTYSNEDAHNGIVNINFNDLFIKKYNIPSLSDFCWIKIDDGIKLSINIDESLSHINPDLTLKFSGHEFSSIEFRRNKQIISKITKNGVYRISYDLNNNLTLIPISQ